MLPKKRYKINFIVKYLLIIFITLLSSKTSSIFALEDAKEISSVWEMKSQSCDGIFVNSSSSGYKDNDLVKQSKEVVLKNLGFKFKIPQLSNTKETVVKLFLNDKSRGVTDHYLYLSDDVVNKQFAAVVFTELPIGTKASQAFRAVFASQKSLASKSKFPPKPGVKVSLNKIDGPHGVSYEMIQLNRVASFCFPTSNYYFSEDKTLLSTIGISRYSYIENKLIEFAVIVEIPKDSTKSEAIAHAKKIMDGFWLRLIKL